MKRFKSVYNDTMNHIVVNDKNNLIQYTDIFYESLLKIPKTIFNLVKCAVLSLNNDNDEIKIPIKDILNDEYFYEFDEDRLYSCLKSLFENNEKSYFIVKIDENPYDDKKGEFIPPQLFFDILFSNNVIKESALPQIKPITGIKNDLIKSFCDKFNFYVNEKHNFLNKMQLAIKAFKEEILLSNGNNFGTIIIHPNNCTLSNENLNEPTLDETIIHECQHLCIFLLSIAKTCIYLGMHFSNDIQNGLKYELKETEFITLFTSYKNILKRIYNSVDSNKSMNEFIHSLLNMAINRVDDDNKYTKALKSSKQLQRILDFYRKIYEDENYSKQDTIFNKHTLRNEKTPITYFKNNMHKFKTLIKWTVKGLENEEI